MINIDFNKIYHTKSYGDFKIIENLGYINGDSRLWVKIKFLTTGYERIIRQDHLYRPNLDIQDPYYPRIFGCACMGEGVGARDEYKPDYDRWLKMVSRCRNEEDKDYPRYGLIGVDVDEEWLTFANYYHDIKELPGYRFKQAYPQKFQLDKDYLQYDVPPEEKIYSKDTCIWAEKSINSKMTKTNTHEIPEIDYVDRQGNPKRMTMCKII